LIIATQKNRAQKREMGSAEYVNENETPTSIN